MSGFRVRGLGLHGAEAPTRRGASSRELPRTWPRGACAVRLRGACAVHLRAACAVHLRAAYAVHLLSPYQSSSPFNFFVLTVRSIYFHGTNRRVHKESTNSRVYMEKNRRVYMERRVISRTSSSVFSGAVEDLATSSMCASSSSNDTRFADSCPVLTSAVAGHFGLSVQSCGKRSARGVGLRDEG